MAAPIRKECDVNGIWPKLRDSKHFRKTQLKLYLVSGEPSLSKKKISLMLGRTTKYCVKSQIGQTVRNEH